MSECGPYPNRLVQPVLQATVAGCGSICGRVPPSPTTLTLTLTLTRFDLRAAADAVAAANDEHGLLVGQQAQLLHLRGRRL